MTVSPIPENVIGVQCVGQSTLTYISRLTEVITLYEWWDYYVSSSVTWTQYIKMCSIIFNLTNCKCPDVLSRTAIHYSHTTGIGTVNCSLSTTIISPEGIWQSPLVGSDPAAHLTVWSSTDREEDWVTGKTTAASSTTSSLGVSSQLPARGTVGVGVCHIQVDCTSPIPSTSTCITYTIVDDLFRRGPINFLQIISDWINSLTHLIQDWCQSFIHSCSDPHNCMCTTTHFTVERNDIILMLDLTITLRLSQLYIRQYH